MAAYLYLSVFPFDVGGGWLGVEWGERGGGLDVDLVVSVPNFIYLLLTSYNRAKPYPLL